MTSGDVADLLRRAREDNLLSQEELSLRSGVPQSAISAFERRKRLPRLDVLANLFAAMQLQLHVETEPLMHDLDARIDALAAMTVEERINWVATRALIPWLILARLAGTGAVLTGAMAAVVQGAPVPVERLEFDVARHDETLAAVTAALAKMFARNEALGHARPGVLSLPEAEPESVWRTASGEIVIRLVAAEDLAASGAVVVQGYDRPEELTVTPLWRIEARDRTVSRVLSRMRERLR